MKEDFLTPRQAAEYLGCDPQSIRVAARERPDLLGFPVNVMGSRTRIPKEPFFQFVKAVKA